MIKQKTLHYLGFESNKSTEQDVYANDVVLNTRLLDRDTSLDPYARSVVFNMRCDGESGSFYHYDDCGNIISTRQNYDAIISTTITRDGRPVLNFPNNSWIQYPHHQDFQFGYDNFTIEFWAKFDSHVLVANYQTIIALRNLGSYGPWVIGYNPSQNKITAHFSNAALSAWTNFYSNYTPVVDTWFHCALVRNGTNITFYIDGVNQGSITFTDPIVYSSAAPLMIGGNNNNTEYLYGSLQDIRITKGIARYTDTFTPPANIPAITPIGLPVISDDVMGNAFNNVDVEYQATGGPFNGPCMYFNGASYLDTLSNSSLDIFDGTTPATLEMWFKVDKFAAQDGATNRNAVLFSNFGTSIAVNNFNLMILGNSTITGTGLAFEVFDNNSSFITDKSIVNIKCRIAPGDWNHLAFTREHPYGPIKLYFNGKQLDAPGSHFKNIFQQKVNNNIRFGMSQLTSYNRFFIGWMSGIRITRKCRYFGEFTPATSEITPGEELSYDTSLLIHFNDAGKNPEFGRINDFKSHTITATGTPLLQAQSPFMTGSSIVFNGTSDYLTYTYDSRFDLSTGDWTIEYWLRPGSITANQVHIGLRNPVSTNGIWIGQYSPNQNTIRFWAGDSNTASWEVAILGTTILQINKWYHIAVTRSGSTFQMFINGILQNSATWAGTIYINSANLTVGANSTSTYYFNGAIDDLRITKGVARYTEAFTPPTAPLPHGSDDPNWANVSLFSNFDSMDYFIDEAAWHPFTSKGHVVLSSDQSKFGNKSVYFGSTGVLTTPHREDLHLPGDFTIEGWVFPTVTNADQWILTKAEASGGSYPSYTIKMLAAGTIQFVSYSADNVGNNIVSATFGTPTANDWNHFAIVRSGTAWTGYLNGVGTLLVTSALNPYNNTTNGLAIGGDWVNTSGRGFTGYLDEIRIIKGAAKYSADFSVPTKPFEYTGYGDPHWDKVVLALPLTGHNGSTTFIDRSPLNHAITNSNVIYASTDIRKFGNSQGTAAYFNGTSARLTFTPNGRPFNAQLDWTVEGWLYSTSSGANRGILCIDGLASTYYGHYFVKSSANKLKVDLAKLSTPTTTLSMAGATTVTDNVWHHFAFTKRDKTVKIFLDGVLDGTLYLSEEVNPPIPATIAYVGSYYNSTEWWSGYLQDLRITTTCKYNNTFTPPTAPLGYFKGSPVLACKFEGNDDGIIFTDDFGNQLTTNGSAVTSIDAFKFGSSSGYFTGASDYLTVSNGLANFNWGDDDFTIDCWVKTASSTGDTGYIYKQDQSGATIWLRFGDASVNHALQACVGNSTLDILTTTLTKTDFTSAFKHVQLSKRYKSFVLYVDGEAVGSKEMVYDINQKSTTLLLLHCNGANNSTTFTDSSVFARTVTTNGNAKLTTDQSKFGGTSAYFDGTGDYLSLTYSNSFYFPYTDWTIECWFRITALDTTNGNALVTIGGASGFRCIDLTTYPLNGKEYVRIMLTTDGTNMLSIYGTTELQANTWNHIAAVRYRNTIILFLNGAIERQVPFSGILHGSPNAITIGRANVNTNADLTGYIDEVRISSVARYTEAFTPQVAAFDETAADTTFFTTPTSVQIGGLNGYLDSMQVWRGDLPLQRTYEVPNDRIPANSLTIVDDGLDKQTNVFNRGVFLTSDAAHDGSLGGYFDGRGSYLIYKLTHDDWLYSADFTIEMWYMALDNPFSTANRGIFSYRTFGVNSSFPIMLRLNGADNRISFHWQTSEGTSPAPISSTTVLAPFTWYHIAIVRYSGLIKLYLNGVFETSTSFPTLVQNVGYTQGAFNIGNDYYPYDTNHLTHYGYIDSFQFIKGFAKYTKNFIPAPLLTADKVDYHSFFTRNISSDPLFFYKMEDTIDTVLADVSNNSPLTIDDPANISVQQLALNSRDITQLDSSVLFDGAKGSSNLTQVLSLESGLNLSFFIKTTAETGTVFSKETSFNVTLVQGKIVVTAYYNSGTYQITSTATINDGNTHFVFIIFTGFLIQLFIDSVNVALTDVSNIISQNNLIEMPFNYADTNVIFQLRGGETNCDLMENVQIFDSSLVTLPGPFDESMYFNVSNHLEVPRFNLSPLKNLAYLYARNVLDSTIEFWIKVPEYPATNSPFLSIGNPGSGTGTTRSLRSGLTVKMLSSGLLQINVGNLSGGTATSFFSKVSSVPIALNTWTHVAITINACDLNLFQDGVLQTLNYADVGTYPHGSLVNAQIYTTESMNIGSIGYHKGGLSAGTTTSVLSSNHYLADIRISRGVLYNTNFTKPASGLVALTEAPLLSLVPNTIQGFGNLAVNMGSKKINKTNLKLNGTSDYLIVANNDMMIGTFTFDCWVWFKSVTTEQTIVSQSEASLSIKNQKLTLTNGTEEVGTTDVAPNTWHHVALVRTGTTAKAYLNGVLEITHSAFVNPSYGQTQLGARAGTTLLNGLLDAVRLRSSEVWATNFIPPVMTDYIPDPYWDDTVLLIKGEAPVMPGDALSGNTAFQYRFNGYNNTTKGPNTDDIGHYGMTFVGNAVLMAPHFISTLNNISFDGVDDAIVIPNTTAMRFGTTFTLECWIYIIDFAVKRTLFDKREDTTNGLYFYLDTDAKFYFKAGDTTPGWDVEITSSAVQAGWRHIALVRNAANSNSWMLFVDGTQAGTTVNSSIAIADNTSLLIGKNKDNSEFFYGGLTEIIYTVTAKYTGAFTCPSSAALDPMAYENDKTLLLMHFDGTNGSETFLDSSRYNWKAVTSYGTKLSSTQSKFGGTSAYFDGTAGRGIIVEPDQIFSFDEDDFTIDLWVYIASTGTQRHIVGQWCQFLGINQNTNYWTIQQSAGNYLIFYWDPFNNNSPLLTSASTFTTNQWIHVAITKKDDFFTMFINGAVSATANQPRSTIKGAVLRGNRYKNYGITFGNYYDSTNPPKYGTTVSTFSGYIDEFRMVLGQAMWNTPFTPPTSAYSLSANYPVRDSNVKLFIDSDKAGNVIDKTFNTSPSLEGSIYAGTIRGTNYGQFDGTGDAIRLTSVAGDVACGFDDFCLESWVYPINGGRSAQNYGRLFETEQNQTGGGFCMVMNNSGTTSHCSVFLHDSKTSGTEFGVTTSDTIPNAAWSHVAFTREGQEFTSWLNGVPKQKVVPDVPFTADRSDGTFTLSNNNKTVSNTVGSVWKMIASRGYFDAASTTGVYFEGVASASSQELWGIIPSTLTVVSGIFPGLTLASYGYFNLNGKKYSNNVSLSYGASYTTNDVIGVAVKNGKIWFAKNGVWQASGDPITEANPAYTGITGLYSAAVGRYASSTNTLRTTLSEFTYAPPTGFQSIRDANVGYPFTKSKISMGANNSGAESFYGYLSNTRFTQNDTRYKMTWNEKTLVGDAQSANVVLLLNLNSDFTDSNTSAKTVSSTNVTIDTSTKRFGAGSAYFNGTTAYLTLADNADWNFGTGDFTIELWAKANQYPFGDYANTTLSKVLFNQRLDANNSILFILTKTGSTFEVKSGGSTLIKIDSTYYCNIMEWHHYAIVRTGNTFSIFMDGLSVASGTAAITMPDLSAPLDFGRWSGDGDYFGGWMDDIRITKGYARYPTETSSAIVPVALQPFAQKKFQSLSGGRIQPTNLHTAPGKFGLASSHKSNNIESMYSGTHDFWIERYYDLTFNWRDFTIEGWFNPAIAGSFKAYYQRGVNTAGGVQIGVSKNSLDFRFYGTTTQSVTVNITTWAHVVFQRKDLLKQIFLNGVKVSEVATTNINIDDYDVVTYLGGAASGSDTSRYYGDVDGFRITRGVARYTENFTPPTTQFPSKYIQPENSRLNLFFDGITKLPSNVFRIGGTFNQPSSINEKGAVYFDGDEDYFCLSECISKEDFTLEFWFEAHATGSPSLPVHLWSQMIGPTDTLGIGVALVSGVIQIRQASNITSLQEINLYTWYHFAMTRENGLLRAFVNGIKLYEVSVPVFSYGIQALGIVVDNATSPNESRYQGYLKNYRLIKNVVQYTENFTPSTSLSPYSQTSDYLIDTSRAITLGDFIGSLDNVSLIEESLSSSSIQELYHFAQEITLVPARASHLLNQDVFDVDYGLLQNKGSIWGTVTDTLGNPLQKRIVVVEHWSYNPVAETISDPITGYYEFNNLNLLQLYSVIAEDYLDFRYNDIIRAKIKATVR